jgi:uncharacterized HAD superfamily protein
MENNSNEKKEALRYNAGKTRFDLLEPYAIEKLAEVFTKGAEKYADNNWIENGMKWSKMVASLKRHLSEFEKGVDYDSETNCLHAAHIAWNAMALVSYYKYHPESDDRMVNSLVQKRIGLDIDDVVADFIGHWTKHHNQEVPEFWDFDRQIAAKFEILKDDEEFWMSIPPKIKPSELSFIPTCFITSRIIPTALTERWLDKHGFPAVPVFTVGHGKSKVEVAKEQKLDWFVDDNYNNFRDLNQNGIHCFLMDAKHNQRFNVGAKRIYSLKEL